MVETETRHFIWQNYGPVHILKWNTHNSMGNICKQIDHNIFFAEIFKFYHIETCHHYLKVGTNLLKTSEI